MDRFKILKGQEPPPLTEEQKNHAHIARLWEKIIEDTNTKEELQKLLNNALIKPKNSSFITCEYPGPKVLWTDLRS